MIYKVFFQLYGKKMKVAIEAESNEDAKNIIKNSIQFDKVVPTNDYKTDFPQPDLDHLKNIFGMK